ncbi:MAG: hypothetical protein GY768_03590 [Planctomycetaceae bacterium]|nr:hypothetical protein [Planctomycetaceae bacterium]
MSIKLPWHPSYRMPAERTSELLGAWVQASDARIKFSDDGEVYQENEQRV